MEGFHLPHKNLPRKKEINSSFFRKNRNSTKIPPPQKKTKQTNYAWGDKFFLKNVYVIKVLSHRRVQGAGRLG